MRIRYDADADVLLVVVREEAPVDAVEEPGAVIVSYGEDGQPVSVEFLDAAERDLIQEGGFDITLQTVGGPRAEIGAG